MKGLRFKLLISFAVLFILFIANAVGAKGSASSLVTLVVAGVLLTAAYCYFDIAVLKPLESTASDLKKMAGGDFSVELKPTTAQDEVGLITSASIEFARYSKGLVNNIANSAMRISELDHQLVAKVENVVNNTTQLARSVDEVAQGNISQTQSLNDIASMLDQFSLAFGEISSSASQQKEMVESTSIIIDQMVNSIQLVASNSQLVSESSLQTSEAAKKGGNAVHLTIDGMEQIKTKVFDTAAKIKELGERSQQIGEIIQVIDDIAGQTNLLALNAAIEAARAGEHGKGFAVVADEVRKLAERSGKATKEIAELVTNIQQGTTAAISAMEQAASEVEKGSVITRDTGAALDEILNAVSATFDQVQNISAAVEEISAGSTEVVNSINNVAGISEANSCATAELNTGSAFLIESMKGIVHAVEGSAAIAEEASLCTGKTRDGAKELGSLISQLTAATGDIIAQVRKSNITQ